MKSLPANATPPILAHKHHEAPSAFTPDSLLREARRQKAVPPGTVPRVCILDPDGDIVRHLKSNGRAERSAIWACYHTDLFVFTHAGIEFGIVGCAVGAAFAVLIAEELFASGCELLLSVTSAGQIRPVQPPPYFVVIERALRDEGTSYHYLPASNYSEADPAMVACAGELLAGAGIPMLRGATWTTDAPFRETQQAIEAAMSEGILAVEMEAAALYAFAAARQQPVLCLAHVTNQMGRIDGDFEKGVADGAEASLRVVGLLAAGWNFASPHDKSTVREANLNMPAFDLLELLVRAAAATLCGLVAIQFARPRPLQFPNVAGVLFCIGIAAYALIGDRHLEQALGRACVSLGLLAALSPAFFWWFATSLFRDEPQWQARHAAPLVVLLALYVLRQATDGPLHTVGALGHQTTVAVLLLHVLSVAVADFKEDLMDARRRFRLAVAIVLPATGLAIAAFETYALFRPLPAWIGLLQAAVLFGLALLFALWLMAVRPEVMPQTATPSPRPDTLTAAENIELQRLRDAIAAGVCLEPDLSLGALATRLKIPEHRLRRLINQGLGHRNFAAFVNEYRVSQAKRILANPDNSRQQIVAVAFELGYASLAPFNRAFRQLTGMTPTEYRAQALGRVADSRKV